MSFRSECLNIYFFKATNTVAVSLNTTETNDPNASVTKIPQQKMTVNVSAKINSDTTHFCNIKPHAYAVAHLA